jgi:hypothetical protein
MEQQGTNKVGTGRVECGATSRLPSVFQLFLRVLPLLPKALPLFPKLLPTFSQVIPRISTKLPLIARFFHSLIRCYQFFLECPTSSQMYCTVFLVANPSYLKLFHSFPGCSNLGSRLFQLLTSFPTFSKGAATPFQGVPTSFQGVATPSQSDPRCPR